MIFITGDTHGEIDIRKFSTKKFPEQKKLTKSNYIIIAGDFGITVTNIIIDSIGLMRKILLHYLSTATTRILKY